MPWRDGTGPRGEGPLTGRGLGPCRRSGRRQRFGRGPRRGFAQRRYWTDECVVLTKEEEKKALELELTVIKEKLEELK